jgi:citronellol/citronellal dehydrogenase
VTLAKALWWKNVVDTPMKRYDLVQGVNSRGSFACVRAVLPYMIKQRSGHIITMSPPIELEHMEGKVGYLMSKYGMTILAMGLAEEVREFNISSNALWPKTMIESFVTMNFHLGERWMWRKASILADCTLMMVSEPGGKFSGHAVIDEVFMKERGVVDFSRYQCVPGKEPPPAWPASKLGTFRPPKSASVPPGVYSMNAASSQRSKL